MKVLEKSVFSEGFRIRWLVLTTRPFAKLMVFESEQAFHARANPVVVYEVDDLQAACPPQIAGPGSSISALPRHRRRHVHCAGVGVLVLKMTALPRRSF